MEKETAREKEMGESPRGRKEIGWEKVEAGRELSKIEKDVEKRQDDTVYVIRGDGMAVGVVSFLEWRAGSACISVVLIGDQHWVRWKNQAKGQGQGRRERKNGTL